MLDPAMAAHNLGLTLLLLALFTLSSVIIFEISTRPPVYVRQKHEVFITFASDYQLQWYDEQGFDSNLHYSENSLARASSKNSRVVNVQGAARRGNSVIPNQASGGQHATQRSPLTSPISLPPLWVSKSKSKIENPKEMNTDDDTRSRAADTIRYEIPEPIRPDHPPGMFNDIIPIASDSINLVRRMKYVNKMSSSVPRMPVPKLSNPQIDQTLRSAYMYANKSNITAVGYKKHINHPPGPRRLGLQCTDPHCTSYLLDEDYWSFIICEQWTEKKTKINHWNINATCRFMKGVTRQPVGLVSVPGSGNTWVRELLETATGICTGSIYCDHSLRNAGMIGEYIKTGRVIVVKTHTSDYQWNEAILEERNEDDALYGSAILLIRNPFNAFIAEWNRLNAFSTYSGYPIGPKKPTITVSNNHQNRKMQFTNNAKLHCRFKRGIINKSLRPPMSLLSAENHSRVDMIKNMLQRSDNGGQYGHVLPVGRKLLSVELSNKSEDVSHTIVIDKKMFGEYIVVRACNNIIITPS